MTAMLLSRPWWIVLGLALGVTVSNGFARFSYGLTLPAMQADQSWSYAEAGWINTANTLGYFGGALATLALIKRVSPARLLVLGMMATSLSLILSGLTENFAALSLWRVLAGIAGAPVFIAGGALAANLFPDPKRTALAIALYFGGGGVGMVLSGAVLPTLFARYGPDVWPFAWIGLGVASVLFTVASMLAVRAMDKPIESSQTSAVSSSSGLPIGQMWIALVGYGLFATGYIVYVTFLVAWMNTINAGPFLVSATWVAIGVAIIASPFIWRNILARFSNGVPLALATGVTAAGTLLPSVLPGAAALIGSGLLFGIAVFIAPASATAFCRRNLPPDVQGRGIALFTTVFAGGQTIGPVAAGALGDVLGSIESGLVAAGVVLAAGAIVALGQKSLSMNGNGLSSFD